MGQLAVWHHEKQLTPSGLILTHFQNIFILGARLDNIDLFLKNELVFRFKIISEWKKISLAYVTKNESHLGRLGDMTYVVLLTVM